MKIELGPEQTLLLAVLVQTMEDALDGRQDAIDVLEMKNDTLQLLCNVIDPGLNIKVLTTWWKRCLQGTRDRKLINALMRYLP